MIPRRIQGFTERFGPPDEWENTPALTIHNLFVRTRGPWHSSAWKPTPEELAVLNAGGVAVISILGAQPVIMMTVEDASDPVEDDDDAEPVSATA